MNDQPLHEVNEFTFERLELNRIAAKERFQNTQMDSPYMRGYYTGYEQAIIDIQNWIMTYTSNEKG